jgi:hypothetical protein
MSRGPLIAIEAIAGLPWGTWLLLIAAVSLGLVLGIRFYVLHRPSAGERRDRRDRGPAPGHPPRDG